MPTAGIRQRYPLKCNGPGYRLVGGRFAGINGASPTSIFGDGFTVARTGEGVHVITLGKPGANFVAVDVWGVDDDGNHHDIAYTLNAANRTITITQREAAYSALGSVEGVSVTLDDVSAPSSAYVASPVAGLVTGMRTVLHSAITGADATILGRINGVNMGSSSLTVAFSGSAAGDRDASIPNSSNTVAVGDALEVNTDGASSTTAKLTCTFLISPLAANALAAEDIIDEIGFFALVAESDVIGAGV